MKTIEPVEMKLLRIQYSPSAEGTLKENQPINKGRNFRTCTQNGKGMRMRTEGQRAVGNGYGGRVKKVSDKLTEAHRATTA